MYLKVTIPLLHKELDLLRFRLHLRRANESGGNSINAIIYMFPLNTACTSCWLNIVITSLIYCVTGVNLSSGI